MTYKVTYAIDSLDPNPTVETFAEEWEALDYAAEEMQARIDHIVAHSPYSLSEDDLRDIEEIERDLLRIESI